MYDAVNEHIANCCQQTIDDYKEEHASDTAPAEPVPDAWRIRVKGDELWVAYYHFKPNDGGGIYELQPLYAHPPRSVDVEAIKRKIHGVYGVGIGTFAGGFQDESIDKAARSIARMIEGE
jgi:hypothetical protein